MNSSSMAILPRTFISAPITSKSSILTTQSITDIIAPVAQIHISIGISHLPSAMSFPVLSKALVYTTIWVVHRHLGRLSPQIRLITDPVALELLTISPDVLSMPVAFVFIPLAIVEVAVGVGHSSLTPLDAQFETTFILLPVIPLKRTLTMRHFVFVNLTDIDRLVREDLPARTGTSRLSLYPLSCEVLVL